MESEIGMSPAVLNRGAGGATAAWNQGRKNVGQKTHAAATFPQSLS